MIYTDKDFVLLYAHNVPVKGDDEGVIYDLQKGRLLYIPADIVDVFNDSRELNMGQLKKKYVPSDESVMDQYMEYFIGQDWAFVTNNPERYPALDFSHCRIPSLIYNAIVDVGPWTSKTVEQLSACNCKFMDLMLDQIETVSLLPSIAKTIDTSTIIKYNLYCKVDMDLEKMKQLLKSVKGIKFSKMLVSKNSTAGQKLSVDGLPSDKIVLVDQEKPLGKKYVSYQYFAEALYYDTYRHKKIYVDRHGYIYNVPGDNRKLGNISSDNLRKICKGKEYLNISNRPNPEKDSCLRYSYFASI